MVSVICVLRVQILLVGDSGVGKSSLLMRFTAGQFEESSVPTIGEQVHIPSCLGIHHACHLLTNAELVSTLLTLHMSANRHCYLCVCRC